MREDKSKDVTPQYYWEDHTINWGENKQDSETSKQFSFFVGSFCPDICSDNHFKILASLEKRENLMPVRLHLIFSEICINKNVPERRSDVSRARCDYP